MNNQKDTKKTSLNSYGQNNVLDIKSLENRHIYEFVNKKTEKLVTALYMVTDCMNTEDAIKGKLRHLGVELLSDMYKISSFSPVDKHTHIIVCMTHIDELVSFIEIAYTIGFISDMNMMILKKEFLVLMGELESHLKKDKHFTFTLDEQMFVSARQGLAEENGVKDKRTTLNNMSFMNTKTNHPLGHLSKTTNHNFSVSEKKDRTDRILALIKDKDVSIKDISNSFTNCSEKTIQRELNALVLKGQIKKTGSKRWSRYQAVVKV